MCPTDHDPARGTTGVPSGRRNSAATTTTPHTSDSVAQRDAEPLIIEAVAAHVGVPLAPARITFDDGVRVETDGASEDRAVLVEAYAHTGTLRGGQPKSPRPTRSSSPGPGGRSARRGPSSP